MAEKVNIATIDIDVNDFIKSATNAKREIESLTAANKLLKASENDNTDAIVQNEIALKKARQEYNQSVNSAKSLQTATKELADTMTTESKSDLLAQLDVFKAASDNFNRMAQIEMNDEAAVRFFLRITNPQMQLQRLNVASDLQTPDERSATAMVSRLMEANESAPGARPGTLWGALNAVTWMEDHGRRFKNEATRIDTSQLGVGAARKKVAYRAALDQLAQAA
jgi:hypothetical protein